MSRTLPARRRRSAIGVLIGLAGLSGPARLFADAPPPDQAVREGSLFEEYRRQYPASEANSAALDVERLSAAVGIDVAAKFAESRMHPTPEAAQAFGRIKAAAQEWLHGVMESASTDVPAPPREVGRFLASHAQEIRSLRKGILRGEPPAWEEGFERGYAAPLPNVLGLIELQRLLIVHALVEQRSHRPDDALEDLDASWKLNERLSKHSAIISRLIAMAVTGYQLGALRHLDRALPTWRERIARLAPVDSILEVLKLEIADLPQMAAELRDEPPSETGENLLHGEDHQAVVERAARRYVAKLDEVRLLRPYCDAPFVTGPELAKEFPWFEENHFTSLQDDYLRRAARQELDLEMTLKILDLRRARDENQGRWPETLGSIEKSAACPQDRWTYDAPAGGGMSLTFSRKPDWGAVIGIVLPTRYEERVSRKRSPRPETPK